MAAVANLLEREPELAELERVLARAGEGEGCAVVIEGAAGIGKTSLLRAVRDQAAAGGEWTVLTARGTELEQTLPYGVVRQLFERVVARASAEERGELLAGAAAHAEAVVAGGGFAAPAGEDSAFAVVHGLYWLAANLAERRPLVLAIDDLHWADAASLEWLAYLAHRIDGLPLLAAATVRPLRGDAAPTLADLLADPSTLVLRPSPLTRDAAAVLIGERIDVESFEQVSEAAHDATAGNPLLLRELAGALAGTNGGDVDFVAEVRRLAPEVVSRRVQLTLAKLGAEATALARAVAVMGDDAVCASCVPEQAGLEDAAADRVAGVLARAEVLRDDRPLRFVHPLVRQAVYESMSPLERDAAHRRAASLLAEMGAPVDRVAAQLILAPPAEDPRAVEALRAAARTALWAGAAESAETYLRRALAEPPPAELRAEVLIELAGARGITGSKGMVDALREALELVGDTTRRIEIRRQLARGLFWRARESEAVVEIEAALAEVPADEAALRRTLEAEYLSAALRMPDLYEEALTRLDGVEVGVEDDSGALMLLALKSYAAMLRGERREEAIALAERALAKGVPTEEAPSWSLWGAVSTLMHADRFEPALRVVDEAIAEASRRGAAYTFSGASMVRASIRLTAGALADAEADARSSVEAVPDRGAMIMPLAYGVLAEVLVERGLLDDAAAVLREAGGDGPIPESFGHIPLLTARTMLRLASGDAGGALADAEACSRAFETVGFRNPAAARWRSLAALAHLAGGEAAEARRLASEELELARAWGSERAIGRSLRVLGLAKGGKAGLALLEESVETLERSPALLERTRSLVELGSALRRAGKRVEAREYLRAGAELAQRCGADRLAAKAHEELLAAGAKPRSTALSGVESLTPSERRVAAMAAEGMGNREIAQALFVTLRTVEMHLSNAFRKLDLSSRTQLVDALAGAGAS